MITKKTSWIILHLNLKRALKSAGSSTESVEQTATGYQPVAKTNETSESSKKRNKTFGNKADDLADQT